MVATHVKHASEITNVNFAFSWDVALHVLLFYITIITAKYLIGSVVLLCWPTYRHLVIHSFCSRLRGTVASHQRIVIAASFTIDREQQLLTDPFVGDG